MKYLVLIPDGLADWKCQELGNRTPLEYASPENMNYLAKESICGIAKTIPDGFEPGSDIANLTILGIDPRKHYTGRGPIEALSMGVPGKIFFRCNLVFVEKGIMIDYSGNRIGDTEAKEAFRILESEKPFEFVHFHHGVTFRGILSFSKNLGKIPATHAPHDIMGQRIEEYLPERNELGEILIRLMEWSEEILQRIGSRANMIWPWSGGKRPEFPDFRKKYGLSASMISEVDLMRGIGKGLGMNTVEVEGMTAYIDTNYRGIARAVLKELRKRDFVLLHTEGIDEVGHEGDAVKKVEAILMYDEKILGYLLDRIDLDETKILLIPDHPTPVRLRTHTSEPVPFAIKNDRKDDVKKFSESECKKGKLGLIDGLNLMKILLGR